MKIDFEKQFNDENIENVRSEMNDYLPELLIQEKSMNNMRKIINVFDKIFSFENKQIMELVIQYSNLKQEEKMYENWLAYYLGFQKGLEKK